MKKRVKIIKQRGEQLLRGVLKLDKERLAARISIIFNAPLTLMTPNFRNAKTLNMGRKHPNTLVMKNRVQLFPWP